MHVLYFDAVKRETARQTEGERHTDRDFITFILFILCFHIDGRERERERERERHVLYMHALYFDAVKRQTDRGGETYRHRFHTYILFILCFYIGGRERERERETETERERDMCILLIRCFY